MLVSVPAPLGSARNISVGVGTVKLFGWRLAAILATLFLTQLALVSTASAGTNCAANPADLSFASGSINETQATVTSSNCHALPGLATGDVLALRMTSPNFPNNGSSFIGVRDSANTTICSANYSQRVDCQISGTGPWRIEAGITNFGNPVPYRVMAKRVNDPQGCTAIADHSTWSQSATATAGNFDALNEAECFTFTKAAASGESSYLFRAPVKTGSVNPLAGMYRADGTTACQVASLQAESICSLQGSGDFTAVVTNGNHGTVGTYELHARRLDEITGCDPIGTDLDDSPKTGALTENDSDCFELGGAVVGDRLNIATPNVGTSQQRR